MPYASSSIPGPIRPPSSSRPARRRRRPRVGPALLALAVATGSTGCGDGTPDQLSVAASSVDDIRSGVLRLEISVRSPSSPPSRLTVRGPFRLQGGRLDADLRYRRVEGSAEAEVRFVAVDGESFVASGGALFELPPARGVAVEAPTLLRDLAFDRWAAGPTIADEGAGTITVVSGLDEAPALDGVLRALDALEFDAPPLRELEGAGGVAAAAAITAASMVVRFRVEDELFRAITLRFRFRPGPQAATGPPRRDGLLLFSLRILRPNEAVRIRLPHLAPTDTAPGP